ncbi:MAG: acetate--CoA ligase [Candidatus Melainabacteria bacterium]|nr:acetate--CoA ligase [Candidatus Melainabacteria bacterium]
MSTEENIISVLSEKRTFSPHESFIKQANLNKSEYDRLILKANTDLEGFWDELAENNIFWFKKWEKVLDWNEPFSKWFVGAKTNISYNCLDRHLRNKANKTALIWIGENGEKKELTYKELFSEVCKFSNSLLKLGIKELDRVIIYMPLIPEAVVAMLACARIGAIHSVVFGGFSKEALADRINDAKARLVITADGGYRRGQVVPLKSNVDEALKKCPTIENVIVVQRVGVCHDKPLHFNVSINRGRDIFYHDLVSKESEVSEPHLLDSEHPLFTLYTSGTTGKPKGILHTTGGYILWATVTTKWIFDIKDTDVYWCTADIGWITGHTYVVYGPLSCGATVLLYEGAPNYPDWAIFWKIINENKVSVFYTAPTAIRSFMKAGDEWVKKYNLSSLRLLGSVGEPINPEAWMWYHENIGAKKCPIVDTWWQTETGGILISPLPGITVTKPGSATFPLPGIFASVVDQDGNSVGPNEGGSLVIKKPWPSMLRTIYGDDERYKKNYWSQIKGAYFAGDGARCDEDGYFWILGRVDDVIKVSGHRLSTMEIESALVSHHDVAEAAVVGYPHDIKGEAICAFVVLKSNVTARSVGDEAVPIGIASPSARNDIKLIEKLKQHVVKEIGPIAKPDQIKFTDSLPKTRSGKIMRRLLRDIASGKQTTGDTTTLEDVSVLEKLRIEEE